MMARRSPKRSANRAKDRLADAPCQVLDGDGHRKLGARPVELGGNRDLEHAEAGADGEAQHQDHAACDQDGVKMLDLGEVWIIMRLLLGVTVSRQRGGVNGRIVRDTTAARIVPGVQSGLG